jgi:hypothetical protein
MESVKVGSIFALGRFEFEIGDICRHSAEGIHEANVGVSLGVFGLSFGKGEGLMVLVVAVDGIGEGFDCSARFGLRGGHP